MKTKKTIFSMILCVCMIVAYMPVIAYADFNPGSDSKYHITNLSDLEAFRDTVNGGNDFSGKTVVLDNNINCDGTVWESCIAKDASHYFKGSFDGNGKTISNLKINIPNGTYVGLFGTTFHDGIIKNVTLDNVNIIGEKYVSGIVGKLIGSVKDCTVKNCTISGTEQVAGITGYVSSGGVVGCTVDNCTISGTEQIGGIVGKAQTDGSFYINKNTIKNSSVTAAQVHENCPAGAVVCQIMANTGGTYSISGNKILNVSTTTTINGSEDKTFIPVGNFRTNYWDANAVTDKHIVNNTWEPATDPDSFKMKNSDATSIVTIDNFYPSCVINDAGYDSIAEALADASDGQTIKVLKDMKLTAPVDIDKKIILDLGEKSVSPDNTFAGGDYLMAVKHKGDLTITGNGTIDVTSNASVCVAVKMTVAGDTDNACPAKLTVKNGTIKGKDYAISGNGDAGYDNTSIVIDGGNIEATNGTNGTAIYQPQKGDLTINGGKIEGENGIYVKLGKLSINGGEINGTGYQAYTANNNGVSSVGAAVTIDSCDPSGGNVSYAVISGGSFTATNSSAPSVVSYNKSGVANGEGTVTGFVKGGTFSNDVTEYCAKGYYTPAENGSFKVDTFTTDIEENGRSSVKAEDKDGKEIKDKSGSLEVRFEDFIPALITNSQDLKTIQSAEPYVEPINLSDSIKTIISTGEIAYAVDMGVKINGVKLASGAYTNQKVTIILPYAAKTKPTVYHGDTPLLDTDVTWTPNAPREVGFIAPSFSNYTFVYQSAEYVAADKATIKFKATGDPNKVEVYAVAGAENPAEGKSYAFNRLFTADLTFSNDNNDVYFTVEPAEGLDLVDKGNKGYEFHFNGEPSQSASGAEVLLGYVIFGGTGEGKFTVDTTVDTNIITVADQIDNIVNYYTPAGGTGVQGKIEAATATDIISSSQTAGTAGQVVEYVLEAVKSNLTVNIAFNNTIEDQKKAYQQMKVTVSGGDLTEAKVYELGSDSSNYNLGTAADGKKCYQVKIGGQLTKNMAYKVEVTGEGYRTASYRILMNDDEEILDFWNNVKDSESCIDSSDASKKCYSNFLAGDIYMNGVIDIYDLSAVVSYFGNEFTADTDTAGYAKYDLNRDGKIDSKDVAYVLVSWGK